MTRAARARAHAVLLPLAFAAAACDPAPHEAAVAARLADPKSARYQAVRSRAGHVCGEVNARDAAGTWQGYRRFLYDTESGSAALDPRNTVATSAADPTNPACAKPLSYRTVEERFACETAPELVQAEAQQSAFDERWRRICEP